MRYNVAHIIPCKYYDVTLLYCIVLVVVYMLMVLYMFIGYFYVTFVLFYILF